jgi:2-iminobutanoate/2-iminopropanoate deaminase
LSSPHLPQPRFHYSPMLRVGPWVRVSGMIGLDPDSGVLEPGGAGAETARILRSLTNALPDCGLTLNDLVAARIFTTRFDQFPAINQAWEAALRGLAVPPCRTSVGVSALPLGASVEIEFDFYQEEAS